MQNYITEGRRAWLNRAPTPSELHGWLYGVLWTWLPKYSVCPGHASPFEYFSDRYFDREVQTILWGPRSGSKSFMTGLENWLKGRFQPLSEGNIVSGSLAQAKNAYKATEAFWTATDDIGGRDVLSEDPLVSITKYKSGAFFEIGTSSEPRQRGPHPNRVYADEIDEMDVKVFNAAMNQSMTKNGYPASTALLSTMHKVGGLMANWVDNADAKEYRVYKYCILEVMEGCYDYSCDTCALDEWCHGRMKVAMAAAENDQVESGIIKRGERAIMGFIPVEDVIKKVKQGAETTDSGLVIMPIDVAAELFCERPSKAGLVYSLFDTEIHVVADMQIDKSWVRYRAIDVGINNPWVCLYIAVDPMGRTVYIYDEIYLRQKNTIDMAVLLTGYEEGAQYEFTAIDVSAANDRSILLDMGIGTVGYASKVGTGIQLIRNALQPRLAGQPGLLINGSKCPNTIREFLGYRYKADGLSDDPIKDNDHALDALRYWFFVYKMGPILQAKARYR